jgi:hypothetical protein
MPFCPNCRGEYQDWVKECLDCKVPLVEILAPQPKAAKKKKPVSPPLPRLITIASYRYPTEAYLAGAKLESERIWSFVANENIIMIYWLFSEAVGGVKLQVHEDDAPDAQQILQLPVETTTETLDNAETCPNCHSVEISFQAFNISAVFLIWLISYLFWRGFILPVPKRKWKCCNCGYQWKGNRWQPPVKQTSKI